VKQRTKATVTVIVVVFAVIAGILAIQLLPSAGRGGTTYEPRVYTVALSSSECSGSTCVARLVAGTSVPESASSGRYYADLIILTNPSKSTDYVTSVQLLGVSSNYTLFGTIGVYYYISQSEFNPDGAPLGTPAGSCATASVSGCQVFHGNQRMAPGASQYIVVLVTENGEVPEPVTLSLGVIWS